MCGIVGILGQKPVAGDIVEALRRLEYRGYDSAGVATVENGHLDRRRAEGKLKNLEVRLRSEPLVGTPDLTFKPFGSTVPVAVSLSPVSATTWTGTATILTNMPSGQATLTATFNF